MKTKIFKAFTLIELLIVIVIIGILATALIPRITGMQNKARYARVEKDFRDFRTAVFLAQTNTNKPLKDITGNTCTGCTCGYASGYFIGMGLHQLSVTHACKTQRVGALRLIESAAGLSTGTLSTLETDPWGSPYLLDENEGNARGGCAYDTIHTVGPNHDADGVYVIDARLNTGDNRGINIASQGCPGSY